MRRVCECECVDMRTAADEGERELFDNGVLGSAGWTTTAVGAVGVVELMTELNIDVKLDATGPDTGVMGVCKLVAPGAVATLDRAGFALRFSRMEAPQQASLPSFLSWQVPLMSLI